MTEQLQLLANQVADSLRAAASEVLGNNYEKFNDYFRVYSATVAGKECIAVVEQVTGQETTVAISIQELQKQDGDEFYYSRLRGLAQLIDPFIPSEEKIIPKNEWPEPKWQPPGQA